MSDMFTVDRALYRRAVALYMQGAAAALGLRPDEAFVVGWLHDAAYAFGGNRSHVRNGGVCWCRTGTGIGGRSHCMALRRGCSLLNIAGMCVDSRGHVVGFDRRLEDVRTR